MIQNFIPFRKLISIGLAFVISSASISQVFAEGTGAIASTPPKIELSAVVRDGENYDLYVKNRPDDASDLKLYDGSNTLSNSVTYKPNGVVRVNGVMKSMVDFSLERWENQTDSGGIRTKTATSKTISIGNIFSEKTYLKNGVRREIMRDQAVYLIPVQFEKNFSDMAFSGVIKNDGVLRTRYSISIGSGPDLPLEVPDSTTPFDVQKAYVTPSGIIIREQTFPDRYNRVKLKLDGNTVNWITVKKESDIIGNLIETKVSSDTGETFVYLHFQNIRDIKDLSLFEFTINGQFTVPEIESGTGTKSTTSTWFGSSGPIILKIRPENLGKGETAARIVVKEKSSSLYDVETVDLSSFIAPKISSIDTVIWGAATMVKINVNPASLYGDYEKLTIVLNWTGLTARWTKNPLKNADGTTKTDIHGNELFEFLNKQEFRKTNAGLEFSIETDRLKKTGNTMVLKNGNSGRDSFETTFDLNSSQNSNGNSVNVKKESFIFTPATQQPSAVDPVTSTTREVALGNLAFKDLEANEYYRITAKFNVSSSYNPFAQFDAGWSNMFEYGDGGGTTFEFTDEKLGSAIQKEFPIVVRLSDFLAEGKKTSVSWKEVKLEKTTGDGWKTVFVGEGQKGAFTHSTSWGKCSDGNADVCGKNGMPTESSATFSFAFGEAAKAVTEPAKTDTATSTGTTSTTTKKNDPWKISASGGNGPIGKLLNEKLGNAFGKVKDKYSTDPKKRTKLTAAKKSVEQALRSAKKYEEAKTKAAKNLLKKSLVKDLKDALRKMAETGK